MVSTHVDRPVTDILFRPNIRDFNDRQVGAFTAIDVNTRNTYVYAIQNTFGPGFPFTLDSINNCK